PKGLLCPNESDRQNKAYVYGLTALFAGYPLRKTFDHALRFEIMFGADTTNDFRIGNGPILAHDKADIHGALGGCLRIAHVPLNEVDQGIVAAGKRRKLFDYRIDFVLRSGFAQV